MLVGTENYIKNLLKYKSFREEPLSEQLKTLKAMNGVGNLIFWDIVVDERGYKHVKKEVFVHIL